MAEKKRAGDASLKRIESELAKLTHIGDTFEAQTKSGILGLGDEFEQQETSGSKLERKKHKKLMSELTALKAGITAKSTAASTPGVRAQTSALVGNTGQLGSSVTPTLSVLV